MTINELITELQRRRGLHGGDTEILVTWEGIFRDIDPRSIYLGKDSPPTLLIDAYDRLYKKDLQHPDDVKNDLPVNASSDG